MARTKNKKKKKDTEDEPVIKNLKEETVHAIVAVLFFVAAVFLIMSPLNLAGVAGEKIYNGLSHLLGIGYFLLPLLLVMLGVALFRSIRKSFAVIQTIGGFLFFISGLGIISLASRESGGVIGKFIASPLVALFDVYASMVILIAFLVISILVIFDTPLFSRLWKKKEVDEDLFESDTDEQSEELLATNNEGDGATLAPEEEKKPFLKKIFGPKEEEGEEELPINPKGLAVFTEYNPPPLSLLERDKGKPGVGDIKANANIIKRTLQNFGINVEMDEISVGPTVTRYALKPAEGVKLSRIVGLQNDLALALAAHPIRIEAPIPGKSLVGIEIPNSAKTTVGLGTLLSSNEYQGSDKPLLGALGKSISGQSHFANIAKMPHMLIAGATGSGKSVTIHALITSLLYRNSPENLKFIMVDPKRVELTLYNKIPHLLTPVITDAKKAILALKWAAKEMDRRYDILEAESVRDIESYHANILQPELNKARKRKGGEEVEKLPETMPYIIIIIDELADIMQAYPRELEAAIVRLAQMSRAVGIHLVLSTQRPSVNVITGLIKANIPARIALQVSSQIDSRTILDMGGAEKLLGAGDMLYMSGEMSQPRRIQSAFISESEVKKVTKHLADSYADELSQEIDFSQNNDKNSIFEAVMDDGANDEDEDDLYEDARAVVMEAGKASTSYLQRKLRVGYARAARLMDILEERGVIGPADGSRPREVLGQNPQVDELDEEN